MKQTRSSILTIALCAAVAAGCSEGAARHSFTGPSAISVDTGVGSGTLMGDRSNASRPASVAETFAWAGRYNWNTAADGLAVEGTDTITAVDGTCPTPTITVRGVPVAVTAATTFTAPMACADLAAGTTVHITGLLTVTSEGFSVTATSIGPASDSSGGSDDGGDDGSGSTPGTGGGKKARGEGVIGAITGSCPTLTLIITGTRVSTSATTEYVNGSCETLRPGTKVTIDGTLNPGGTATAEKIEIHRVPGRNVSGDGMVNSVTGACPALTLSVRGVKVTTSEATTFTGGECSDIKAGTQIDVTGEYDGAEVVATAVAIKGSRPGNR